MALRVLLADESSTIKKVMQLALQDFGIEVKLVPIGLDVMQVARGFNPDIVFADVLLAKRNGYDVSGDIKSDPTLRKIPVVLMWSGFMELDEAKAVASRADRRLEKPFDAETLRSLVKELVPHLGTNKISSYLSFPEMPEFVEENRRASQEEELEEVDFSNFQLPEEPVSKPPAANIPGRRPQQEQDQKPSPQASRRPIPVEDNFPKLEEIEEPEEFQSIPLPKNQGLPSAQIPKASSPQDDWARQDLSKYKIELPQEDLFTIDEADLTHTSIAMTSGIEEISLDDLDNPEPRPKSRQNQKQAPLSKNFFDWPRIQHSCHSSVFRPHACRRIAAPRSSVGT
jgi:two-component system cell cycle response regulator